MKTADPQILRRNIALLQQQRPQLLSFAATVAPDAGFRVIVAPDGMTNVEVSHPPTHAADRVHDAARMAENVADLTAILAKERESLVFLVGLGLGHEAVLLANTFPGIRLVILEPHAALFTAALQNVDLTPLLTHPACVLLVGDTISIAQILQQEDDALRALPFHLVAQQKLLELFPDIYGPLYTTLQTELLHFKEKLRAIVSQGPLLFKNTLTNIPCLASAAHAGTLAHLAQGLPAVCVGAGPSLTKNIDLLKGQERKVFIIAVDSAAKILYDHDIIPHLIVTIDPIPASMTKLREVIALPGRPPLAWTPEAFPETVRGFAAGTHFVIPGVNDLFRIYLAPLFADETSFPHMLSVMHAATHLALVAGCDPVIFIGLDLALNGTNDHADGCPVSWKNFDRTERFLVPGWDGGEVETIAVLRNQMLAMRRIITEQRERTFIDATEGGALIAGTKVMPLHEALRRHSGQQMAFDMVIANIFRQATRPSPAAEKQTLRDLLSMVKNSRDTAREGLKNGMEAKKQWKIAKIPAKKPQAIKKFKKAVVASGNAFDHLMGLLDLTNALYPLRATAHHEFIHARKKFNESASNKTAEQSIFEEIDQNMTYFRSWLATAEEAEKEITRVLNEPSTPSGTGKPQ